MELLEDHPYAAAQCPQGFAHFAPRRPWPELHLVDLDFTVLKCFQPVDAAQQRTLAAAGWADHRRHLATPHRKRYAVEYAQRPVVLHQLTNFDHATPLK